MLGLAAAFKMGLGWFAVAVLTPPFTIVLGASSLFQG